MDVFIDVINWFFEGLGEILLFLFSLFPDSPFLNMSDDPPDGVNLGYITWMIPFPTMILHLGLFLVAVASYYAFRIVARWVELVRS